MAYVARTQKYNSAQYPQVVTHPGLQCIISVISIWPNSNCDIIESKLFYIDSINTLILQNTSKYFKITTKDNCYASDEVKDENISEPVQRSGHFDFLKLAAELPQISSEAYYRRDE